jgi:hypothetical protein
MKLQILEPARDDLIEGFNFYEESQQGLGDYFLSSLYSDIESLKMLGGVHRKVYRHFHRALSKRFPFAVYYTVEGETVVVRAVVDCRRNPSWIRDHIRNA